VPFGRMVEIACALINNPEILTDRYAMNISEPSGSVPCVISFLNDNSAFPEIARAK